MRLPPLAPPRYRVTSTFQLALTPPSPARGTPLEVCGARELAFYPGAAVGSCSAGFSYESCAGAMVARTVDEGGEREEALSYCHGGCYFRQCAPTPRARLSRPSPPPRLVSEDVRILARYADCPGLAQGAGEPSAVRCRVGEGVAVLVGSHPEFSPRWVRGSPGTAAVALAVQLEGSEEPRRRFWRLLLTAARVPLRSSTPRATST